MTTLDWQRAATHLRSRVLVVDDHADARCSVVETLQMLGYEASGCESPREALRRLETATYDLIISDLMMPGMDGLQFLAELQKRQDSTPLVMVTAHGSVATAVQAMRFGAFDYLEKPFDIDQLEAVVAHTLDRARVLGRRCEVPENETCPLIGDSPCMKQLKQRLALVAAADVTVLITGESGTGKELVARSIHWSSKRRSKPLVSLNCPALSATLLESELFGHEQGAFTNASKPRLGRFELADQGTIFLDEVTEIELGLQAKLLRVLQEQTFERVGSSETRKVDVRVVAATNRDMAKEVAEGRFREDLYFRLAVVPVHVPALRERREDIPALAVHLLHQAAKRCGRAPLIPDSSFLERLQEHHWPGNVRELENAMIQLTVLTTGDRLTADAVSLLPWASSASTSLVPMTAKPGSQTIATKATFGEARVIESNAGEWQVEPAVNESPVLSNACDSSESDLPPLGSDRWEQVQRKLFEETLARFEGHRERTAQALGISVRTLSNKLRAWGYEPRQASYRTRKHRAA